MKLLGKGYATLEEVRRVWAAVSDDPGKSIRRLAEQTGMSKTKTNDILQFLQAAGYISHEYRATVRTVIIPFVQGTVVHRVQLPVRSETAALSNL
jgi:hypothetical protein